MYVYIKSDSPFPQPNVHLLQNYRTYKLGSELLIPCGIKRKKSKEPKG